MAFIDTNSDAVTDTDGQVVVRLFNNGSDARQAIGELREEGFRTGQIGAAFRRSSSRGAVASDPRSNGTERHQRQPDLTREEFESSRQITQSVSVGSVRTDIGSPTGPASGCSSASPGGFSTGMGMMMSGADLSRLIPGSDIPTRRTQAQVVSSTNWSEEGFPLVRGGRTSGGSTIQASSAYIERESDFQVVSTESHPMPEGQDNPLHSINEDSWWKGLKKFFVEDGDGVERASDHSSVERRGREIVDDAGARKFRSGEGDRGLLECDRLTPLSEENVVASFDYAYSAGDFETSLKILGLSERESIDFAQQLRSAGAIVTVAAGSRIKDAEVILERNGGRACYAEEVSAESRSQRDPLAGTSHPEAAAEDAGNIGFSQDRIHLFGDVRRAYEALNHAARNEDDSSKRKFA